VVREVEGLTDNCSNKKKKSEKMVNAEKRNKKEQREECKKPRAYPDEKRRCWVKFLGLLEFGFVH
jgi:hypothetical protein